MERFGIGNWRKILDTFKFNDKRTPVDLKDKWRNVFGNYIRLILRYLNSSSISGSATEKASRSVRSGADDEEDIDDSF